MKLLHIRNNSDSFVFSFNEARLFSDIIPELVIIILKGKCKAIFIFGSVWRFSSSFDIKYWDRE